LPIARGQDWGEPGALRDGAAVVGSDQDLMAAVLDEVTNDSVAEVGLLGGDLHRTLGSPNHVEADLRAGLGTRVSIDVAKVDLTRTDDSVQTEWFCAHLVAFEGRRRLFSGRTVVVMNAAFRGAENLGPRAHPNDGLLDVTDGELALSDRVRAARRTTTGTHIPHPSLDTSRTRSLDVEFTNPATVILDGRNVGRAVSMTVRCIPDAVAVVV
jgi:hypothetical protein